MKLSIAIPTFNRCEKLIDQLNSIIYQIDKLKICDIELIVSDNGSVDETQAQATHRLSELSYAHYYRNNSNLGFDRNCEALLSRASGDYVWFISDDDILSNDSLQVVLNALDGSESVAFCYVNYEIDVDGKVEPSRCGLASDGVYSYEDYISKSGLAFSFISSCVINRKLWAAGSYNQYLDTKWYHAFVVRDIIVNENVRVIARPLIKMRGVGLLESRLEKRNSQEAKFDYYLEAYLKLLSFTDGMSRLGYDDEVVQSIFGFVRKDELRQILYYKATSPPYRIGEIYYFIRKLSYYNAMNIEHWLICIPALLSPSCIVGKFYWWILPLYKKIKDKHQPK